MKRRVGVLLGALVAVAAGLGALAGVGRGPRAVDPPDLDPRLLPWAPLAPHSELLLLAARDHSPLSIALRRRVARWETVDGVPHARVEWASDGPSWRLRAVEWLRPEATAAGGLRVVCAQRQVGRRVHRLDPPQPVLELPLRAGQEWSWAGAVRGAPARLSAEVRAATHSEHGPVLEVVQRVELLAGEAPPTERVRTYAPEVGLIAERWTLAAGAEPPRAAELAPAPEAAE